MAPSHPSHLISELFGIPLESKTKGDHILRKRLSTKMVRKDVAARVGVKKETIYRWESNRGPAEARYMPVTARRLGSRKGRLRGVSVWTNPRWRGGNLSLNHEYGASYLQMYVRQKVSRGASKGLGSVPNLLTDRVEAKTPESRSCIAQSAASGRALGPSASFVNSDALYQDPPGHP